MLVRSFHLSDYAEVTELMGNALCENCVEEVKEIFARQLSLDSELVLVAEKDEKIVGVIIGTIDNNAGYCYRLAVDPEYRRQGIGSALLKRLNERFRRRKINRLFVHVNEHIEKALPLYEAFGYTIQHLPAVNRRMKILSGT